MNKETFIEIHNNFQAITDEIGMKIHQYHCAGDVIDDFRSLWNSKFNSTTKRKSAWKYSREIIEGYLFNYVLDIVKKEYQECSLGLAGKEKQDKHAEETARDLISDLKKHMESDTRFILPGEALKTFQSIIIENDKAGEDFVSTKFLGKPLLCAPGHFTVIGGRPGAGKTTSLVSLAREALGQNKTVFYVTLEEQQEEILFRFLYHEYVLCCLANQDLQAIANKKNNILDLKKKFSSIIRGEDIQDPNSKYIRQSYDCIIDYFSRGRLVVHKPKGESLNMETIINDISIQAPNGCILFIDYLQKLPAVTQDLEAINKAYSQLEDCISENKYICIAGSQLNRKADSNDLSYDCLKGSGRIEEMAHTIVLIGKSPVDTSTEYFYKIVKCRNGQLTDDQYLFNADNIAFSKMSGTTLLYSTPTKTQKQNRKTI